MTTTGIQFPLSSEGEEEAASQCEREAISRFHAAMHRHRYRSALEQKNGPGLGFSMPFRKQQARSIE